VTSEEKNNLVTEYAEKIKPILPLAKRAFGSRSQTTPAHIASSEYTRLLVEFAGKDGSLLALANEIGVAYSGLRRRVVTADVSARPPRSRKTVFSSEPIESIIEKIKTAKTIGSREYHAELHSAHSRGFSLSAIARGLGISNTYPLYYGVQRHELRTRAAAAKP
jgi:hypothetical protein